MNTSASPSPAIDVRLLEEAAELLIQLHSDTDRSAALQAIHEWRQRSSMHESAWQRADRVMQSFRQVPTELGRRTLGGMRNPERRRLLQALGVVGLAAPLSLALWRESAEWSADIRTATGEQKTLTLEDGTRLVLNTGSAVNISFNQSERRIQLVRGEIMVTTGHDAARRPFSVISEQGTVRPIGTRYAVRQDNGRTQVSVFEGAVELTNRDGRQTRLNVGEQTSFGRTTIEAASPVDASAGLWEQGMLLARDMRLADWAEEMNRYRKGLLRCSPAVADLRVSGAFPLTDTEAALDMLAKTRPVAVRYLTRYWVTLDLPG